MAAKAESARAETQAEALATSEAELSDEVALSRVGSVQLQQYEAMRMAVAECVRIDEASEIRDKAAALAAYARQRDDKEVENWIAEIKCRACVRIGRLSRELEKTPGARTDLEPVPASGNRSKEATLEDAHVSQSAAQRYEELADAEDEAPTAAEAYYAKCKAEGEAPTLAGLRSALKKERRAEREAQLADRTRKASEKIGTKLYGVIMADPPWAFRTFAETGMDRSADNHYPTMELDAIEALPIPAADDCVLFMWATVPMLPQAIRVMQEWGFAYKSHCIWNKPHAGTGFWFRNKHELLLVGTKGDVPAPAPGEQFCSVIEAPLGPHSAKPNAFAEMIGEMFPNVPAVELFARGPRMGWDVWGNELTEEVA
jgi:N6-adenosine-specific RNA methylase IME4